MDTHRKTPNSDWGADQLHNWYPETVGTTQMTTVADYLQECRDRIRRKAPIYQPATIDQWTAAYRAEYRVPKPAVGEPHRHIFDSVDQRMNPQPLTEIQQERILFTLTTDDRFRRAMWKAMGGGR